MPNSVNPYAMELTHIISTTATSLLLRRSFPLSNSSSLYKLFTSFYNSPTLKIVQSDKNSGLVALHIRHYHAMVMQHLSNPVIFEPGTLLIPFNGIIIWP